MYVDFVEPVPQDMIAEFRGYICMNPECECIGDHCLCECLGGRQRVNKRMMLLKDINEDSVCWRGQPEKPTA